jgi:hypothetical protein
MAGIIAVFAQFERDIIGEWVLKHYRRTKSQRATAAALRLPRTTVSRILATGARTTAPAVTI